ncbi:helix-turn-helix domain-containing protein [Nocardia sp. SC052]|uniref:helix-turn-helix domain-containing protein n=1 Tax=Nocardia sichangensis TaxID=3385975 RepID=UPI0039A2D59E
MPGYSPAAPVQAHIHELGHFGMSQRTIAADSGVSQETVRLIAAGEYQMVRTRTSVAILSVTHSPNPRQPHVLAIGATRRLQALQTLAWPLVVLAAESGIQLGTLWKLSNRTQKTTRWEIWSAIHSIYPGLSGTPGPSPQTQREAIAAGWLSTMDWEAEDVDIDDPRITPQASGRELPRTTQELSARRAAEAADHLGLGSSVEQIARRMGISERQVERLLKRDPTTQP